MPLHALIFILLLSLVSGYVMADPSGGEAPEAGNLAFDHVYRADEEGFLWAIPHVGSAELARDIRTTRRELKEMRETLTQDVADSRWTVIDVLITVVAPGGLLYAGYKMHAQTVAKERLAAVTTDLEQLDEDLLAFQAIAGREFIALGP